MYLIQECGKTEENIEETRRGLQAATKMNGKGATMGEAGEGDASIGLKDPKSDKGQKRLTTFFGKLQTGFSGREPEGQHQKEAQNCSKATAYQNRHEQEQQEGRSQ